jgi:hypothetical protein
MLSAMANWLFGCSHRRTSFPITFRNRDAGLTHSGGLETYVVCLDCGKHFAYDWAEMRIAKQPAVAAESTRVEGGSRARAPFPAANRILQRLVHHI